MKILLLIISCTIWYASASPNTCCSENEALYRFKCNHSELWLNNNCPYDAYTITEEEFVVNRDDSLTISPEDLIIERDEYCLGEMNGGSIAMVCFPPPEPEMTKTGIIVCSSISIICLILSLLVYLILPNLRDIQGKCMMFTVFSLLMSFIFLAAMQSNIEITWKSCQALAFVLYFWFMCTFSWLNVVSFNVWRSVVKPKWISCRNYLFAFYNFYGWGAPILLLIILLICHNTDGNHIKPKIGETKCWFRESQGLRAYFYGPICALLIINIIMFISTAWCLSTQTKNVSDRKHKSHKYKMGLYLKLFVIMGICWIFEPLSEFLRLEGKYLWVVTDYINCLQGLLIFLLLVVFRKRVRRDLARKGGLCCRGLPKEWATMADEECEELEEDVDELSEDNTPVVQIPTLNL